MKIYWKFAFIVEMNSEHDLIFKLVSDWNMLHFIKIVFTPPASALFYKFHDRFDRKLSSVINFLHLSKQFSLLSPSTHSTLHAPPEDRTKKIVYDHPSIAFGSRRRLGEVNPILAISKRNFMENLSYIRLINWWIIQIIYRERGNSSVLVPALAEVGKNKESINLLVPNAKWFQTNSHK